MGKTIEVHDTSSGERWAVSDVESFGHTGSFPHQNLTVVQDGGDAVNYGWDCEVLGMW